MDLLSACCFPSFCKLLLASLGSSRLELGAAGESKGRANKRAGRCWLRAIQRSLAPCALWCGQIGVVPESEARNEARRNELRASNKWPEQESLCWLSFAGAANKNKGACKFQTRRRKASFGPPSFPTQTLLRRHFSGL